MGNGERSALGLPDLGMHWVPRHVRATFFPDIYGQMLWFLGTRLIELPFTVVKYQSTGLLIWFIGALFFGDSMHFTSHSEPARLRVLDIQTRRGSDGYKMYRPVFALEAAKPPRQGYAGKIWSRQARHQAGEIVSGRYDPESGEMRSDKMVKITTRLGRIAQVLGILVGVQALAILFGFPEQLLPLRIRIGVGQRPRHFWL